MCFLYAYLEERTEMNHSHPNRSILDHNQNKSAYLVLKNNTCHLFTWIKEKT